MARNKAKRRAKAPKTGFVDQYLRPTAERVAHNDFQTAGMAYRTASVLEALRKVGKLSQMQFDNLEYYREQANRAEDDARQPGPLDPERIMGGGGGSCTGGRIPAIMLGTPAIIETSRIERDVGPKLLPILQAVARDNMTLTAWCIAKHGGRERRDSKGAFVAFVPVGEKRVMAEALLELRYAAGAITKGLDAWR